MAGCSKNKNTLFRSLKDHPFSVEAHFRTSLVLTYALPLEELQVLLPPCLEADSYNDQWGFLAVAVVDTRQLRPKGSPAFMGNDFILTGYRAFVRYTTSKGKRLRGLYILGSETNSRKMTFWGNVFTHYNYKQTDITVTSHFGLVTVDSKRSDLHIRARKEDGDLPAGSPFPDWKAARRYAGPLPFTFTFNEKKNEVLIIEGVREDWDPHPVQVLEHHSGFLEGLKLHGMVLANAFLVENIPYYWKKGKIDQWIPAGSHTRD